MEDYMNIGYNMAQARNKIDMTQVELARLVGITQKDVSRYEHNFRCPILPIAKRIAEALGITLDELVK